MTSRLSISTGLLLLLFPSAYAQWMFGEWELDMEQISRTGQTLFHQLAPESVQAEYEFASGAQLAEMLSFIQQSLHSENIGDLARLQPLARQTLEWLRASPHTQAHADWLGARMDFFDMATEAARTPPTPQPPAPTPPPSRTLPPHPPQPAPEATPPPSTNTVMVAHNLYAENKQSWLRKLEGRPAPTKAAAYLPDLKRIFQGEGLPPALVWQAEAESSFNPSAKSPAGAVGLYQFMPDTAQQYGLRLSPKDERLDALKNAGAAAKFLTHLHQRFGDWPLALAAYNCGEGRVSRTLQKTGGRTFADIQASLPAETQMYVPKIAAILEIRERVDLDTL